MTSFPLFQARSAFRGDQHHYHVFGPGWMRWVPLLFVFCLALPLPGWAQQSGDSSFAQWLQEHAAYDVLSQELAKQSPTPETFFKRVRLALQRGQPEQARSLLQSYGSFDTASLEGQRLWLLAQASRMEQKWIQALLEYSQAGDHWDTATLQSRFTAEHNMRAFWQDTWRLWFWDHFNGARPLANSGQKQLLLQAASQGQQVWPESAFWKDLTSAWPDSDWEARNTFSLNGRSFPSTTVPGADRDTITKALAAVALTRPDLAREGVQAISTLPVRQFWEQVIAAFHNNAPEKTTSLTDQMQHPQTASFWQLYGPALTSLPTADTRLSNPEESFWTPFHTSLTQSPPEKALQRLEQELGSSLLSDSLVQTLHSHALGYALVAGAEEAAKRHWKTLNHANLPVPLRAAALLADLPESETVFSDQPERAGQGQLLAVLANAGGQNPAPLFQAPFWIRLKATDQLEAAATQWPLDRGLVYAVNALQWAQAEASSPGRAQRLALLFPRTRAGQEAALDLARKAHTAKTPHRAWRYLSRLSPDHLATSQRIPYWEARAGLEMELGREEEALDSYATLLEMAPGRLAPEKHLKLALLAQRKNRWNWAQSQLTTLWEQKNKLSVKLQAETLFWMAEGFQYQKKMDQALTAYLRVAYAYPGQNIWAVTAMYRAALIYEQNKQFVPAGNLLQEVIKRADRESQKEAAQDRLDGIRARSGQQESSTIAPEFLF